MVFIFVGIFLGFITDKKGYKGIVLIIGFFMLLLSHLIFLQFKSCPADDKCYEGIFPMTLIGMASTMINLTLYPSINYLIKEKYFGTAYGIIESLSNVGLFIGPLVIGDILNTDISDETENQNIQ